MKKSELECGEGASNYLASVLLYIFGRSPISSRYLLNLVQKGRRIVLRPGAHFYILMISLLLVGSSYVVISLYIFPIPGIQREANEGEKNVGCFGLFLDQQ